MKKFALRLETLLRQVEIDLTPEQLALAAAHWDLVLEANGSFNITGITEEAAAAEKHYLDCLLAVPLVKEIKPKLAVDIGSGGGFPGLVLAIAVPDTRFLLLEASVKKAAFLEQAIETLALPNVQVLNTRAEKAGRQGDLRRSADLVTARGVAHLAILIEYAMPLLKPGGNLLAYKGPQFGQEAAESARALALFGGVVAENRQYLLPQSGDVRVLGRIVAGDVCDEKYPRREGMAEKRPLLG